MAGLPRPSTARYGHIRPNPRGPARMTADSAPRGTNGAMTRMSEVAAAAFMSPRKILASSGAATQMAAAAPVPTSSTGHSAIFTIRRTLVIPPIALARDIHRVRPVSAPRYSMLDAIVNSAISSKKPPAPAGWSQRLTSTVRPNASTAPRAIAPRLITEPRATWPISAAAD